MLSSAFFLVVSHCNAVAVVALLFTAMQRWCCCRAAAAANACICGVIHPLVLVRPPKCSWVDLLASRAHVRNLADVRLSSAGRRVEHELT